VHRKVDRVNKSLWTGSFVLFTAGLAALPGIGDEWISLMFALLTVALWIAVAGALYRRGVRIQV
jgi:predicted acyltransferase